MELELIKNSILEIRGKRVILDYELAKLYGIETKRLKESLFHFFHSKCYKTTENCRKNVVKQPND